MPKTIRIAKTAIDDAVDTFGKLPPKAPSDYSLREAIGQIVPAINDSIKKGYNLDEISQLLNQKNITISSATLKQYLRYFGKSKPKQSRAKTLAGASNPVTDLTANQEMTAPSKSTNTTTAQDRDATVEQTQSTDEPYKSPLKAGSEQFK